MRRAILLLICVIGLSPGLPALAQQAASQEADVATLKNEVRELHRQLQEQRSAHEAEMKELRQQLSEIAATQKAAAASQPPVTPPSAADEFAAAVQQAQGGGAPADKGKPSVASSLMSEIAKQSAPLQSFNPDISLVGDFQGRHDSSKGGVLSDNRIVKELELGISGNIDPYARYNGIFSVHPKEDQDTGYDIDVEEAYVSPISPLPYGLDGKLGKFRAGFGKINELHQHALPWPEYPLVIQKFFGEEGLAGEGVSVSWLAPGDKYVELTAQSFTKSKDSLLGGDDSDSFVQLVHLKTFHDLSRESTLEWGLSGAVLPHSDTPGNGHDAVEGMDLTYKWRPTKEGLYKSFKWITEVLASQRDVDSQGVCTWGMYTAPEYQFDRRWAAGLRYDFSQNPEDAGRNTNALGAYLTFMQSEFCYWRLGYQFSHNNFMENGSDVDHTIFLQLDFTLGPHPAHKY